MKILISNSSNVPIYEQIKREIISQILSDDLKYGEALPSIRSLAKDIKISVMTIKKAYDELEAEGYIFTQQGKGSYVSSKSFELAKETNQREIESYLIKVVELSKKYNIDKNEILELFEFLYRGE